MGGRGPRATFGIGGNVLCLDCGLKFVDTYVFPNALGYTIYTDTVMYINYTSIELLIFLNSSL